MISFVAFSQIPSEPSRRKFKKSKSFFAKGYSFLLFLCSTTSGKAVTIYSFSLSQPFCLNLKSPNALDIAKHPLTRSFFTYPPALIILLYSYSLHGLWSSERALNWYFPVVATILLSPMLATYSSVGHISSTHPVLP